jgi:hypothetical protein
MSKQFRFYLLPSDIESLFAELSMRVGIRIIQTPAPRLEPIELESPIRDSSKFRTTDSVSVWCCLTAPSNADVRMRFITSQSHWIVEDRSEVIEFSGCDYDGSVLLIGRFYFQSDMLIGDTIWPKRAEFLKWTDSVFQTAKKLLHYSKGLEAYIGEDARKWRENGGRFASGIRPDGKPIYEAE